MNCLVVVALLVPFVCGDGHHHHTPAPTIDPVDLITHHIAVEVGHMWHSMDYNKDGTFGRDDLEHFVHAYDTDNNGHVSRLEFLAHWNKDDPGLSMVGEGLLVEMDANRDQVIDDKDLDEFHNRIDTNQDGTVNKAEFEAYFNQVCSHQSTYPQKQRYLSMSESHSISKVKLWNRQHVNFHEGSDAGCSGRLLTLLYALSLHQDPTLG